VQLSTCCSDDWQYPKLSFVLNDFRTSTTRLLLTVGSCLFFVMLSNYCLLIVIILALFIVLCLTDCIIFDI